MWFGGPAYQALKFYWVTVVLILGLNACNPLGLSIYPWVVKGATMVATMAPAVVAPYTTSVYIIIHIDKLQ